MIIFILLHSNKGQQISPVCKYFFREKKKKKETLPVSLDCAALWTQWARVHAEGMRAPVWQLHVDIPSSNRTEVTGGSARATRGRARARLQPVCAT